MLKDHLGSTRVVFNEANSVVTSYDYMPFGNIMRSSVNTDVSYQYTGQEYDTELSLHNFRARLYDSDLGMFYAVDPAGQGYSPFAYGMNNPVMYIDKDGKIAWFIPLIGAAIGATINVASNWDNIENVGDFFSFAGVGAVSGAVASLGGPAAWAGAGFVSGFGNTGLQGGNIGQMFMNGGIGGVSGLAGGYAGRWASQSLGGFIVNGFNVSANSAMGGMIFGGIGGSVGGYAGGFTGGLLTTGNLGMAHQMGISGLKSGFALGGSVGMVSNVTQNLMNDRNWFSGRPNSSVVLGRYMDDIVNPTAEDIGSETIKKYWNERAKIIGSDFLKGKEINAQWIEYHKQQGTYFYDRGGSLNGSLNYPMELRMLNQYNRLYNIRPIGGGIYRWWP